MNSLPGKLWSRRQVLASVASASLLAVAGCGSGSGSADGAIELLNVSYDPTRELYRDINKAFAQVFEKQQQRKVVIKASHGGSASQAGLIKSGLEADVATLAMWFDTDSLRRSGLVKEGWEGRLPHNSLPYFSTIVFVVRRGNPKGVKDWPDLVKPGVEVITPSPKTGGNGKLSFLAAWGSVIAAGGDEGRAKEFVTDLYHHVPVLDTGARAATTTFAKKLIGDVHLTWENEARLEVAEANGALEILYPSTSIRAEPVVAVVDANVDRRQTRAAAEAYLEFFYAPEAQEIFARHHYRPIDEAVRQRHAAQFPDIKLFAVESIAKNWDDAHNRFFADRGVFDEIYQAKK